MEIAEDGQLEVTPGSEAQRLMYGKIADRLLQKAVQCFQYCHEPCSQPRHQCINIRDFDSIYCVSTARSINYFYGFHPWTTKWSYHGRVNS